MEETLEKRKEEGQAKSEAKGGTPLGAGPLKGIRVLDLGHVGAGPVGPTFLAEWGAEVIKVETPEGGNMMRKLPPLHQGQSFIYLIQGRNKKSITVDLHTEEGQEAIRRLVQESDVVLENYRPGTLERWQLGYEALKKTNPGLILLRASGFGQDGPYRDRPSGEAVTSALTGLTFVTGFADGPPVRPGYALSSYAGGIFGAMSILSALHERDQSGEGQSIDLALYEPLCRLSDDKIPLYDKLGILRERTGNKRSFLAPVGLYETRDQRWIAILAPDEKDFGRMTRAMGREELAQDPRFNSMAQRGENCDALNEVVADWVKGYDMKEVAEILVRHEVPMSPVFSIQDFFEDPHYQARGNILEVEDPAMGSVKMQDVVPKLSLTPGRVTSAGPLLGQHNQEVYRNLLGLNEEEIGGLREEGTI